MKMKKQWLFGVVGLAACALVVDGCGGGGGAGGGNFNTTIGGAVGSPCTPEYHNEGCSVDGNKRLRVKCTPDAADATKGTWQLLAECVEGKEWCDATKKDPTDASGAKVLSECKPLGNASSGGTSSGGTSSGGTSSGGTSSGGASSGGTSSGGTSSGGTSGGGTTPTPEKQLSCSQEKCAKEWSACAADAACKTGVECAVKCKPEDDKCTSACFTGAGDQTLQLVVALQVCAAKADCLPMCGDGKCNLGENENTCSQDCKKVDPPKCGNGKCDDGETKESCPADCKETTGPKCGDGKCDEGENESTCPADCKKVDPPKKCGNGTCDDGETPDTCPADCKSTGGLSKDCGNLQCKAPENAQTCALDCKPDVTKLLICAVEACGTQWNACKQTAKCLEVLNCAGACADNDTSCATSCLSKADSASQQAMMAFGQCGEQKCGDSGGCKSNSDCNSGEKCSDGKCVKDNPTACGPSNPCPSGQKCESGQCVPETPAGSCKGSDCKYSSDASCQCDPQCEQYKDCCADKAQYCAATP